MKITYREYKKEDKEILLDLRTKLADYAKSIDPIARVRNLPGFVEMVVEKALTNIEKYQGKIWFACDGEKVVGYIIGLIWEPTEETNLEIGPHKLGEVLQLYLEEEYRGKGIGTTLLQMMESYFKENKCDSIWIDVFAPNSTAHNLYKKCGFFDREIGMLKNI